MCSETKLVSKVKAQITRFSHRVSRFFKKPRQKFIHQMIYGIQAAKDVKLSNIARALNEDIPLIKTENRLSRQISKEDFSEQINKALLEEGAKRIGKETVIALDLSDISKDYANRCLIWPMYGMEVRRKRKRAIGY